MNPLAPPSTGNANADTILLPIWRKASILLTTGERLAYLRECRDTNSRHAGGCFSISRWGAATSAMFRTAGYAHTVAADAIDQWIDELEHGDSSMNDNAVARAG